MLWLGRAIIENMKICIFHNLKKGGAIHYLSQITKHLQKNNTIDVYSFQKNTKPKIFKNYYYTEIKQTKNIFEHLLQINFEVDKKSKKITREILEKKYDLILINNDHLVQSPHILKYLGNKNNSFFISHEPRREFYEKTTYDHNSIIKIISRFIRLLTKRIDIRNCKKAKNIITNSYYSQYIFSKIYEESSYVLYPGLVRKKLTKTNYILNNKYISFGSLSRTKGHHLSIKYAPKKHKILIVGSNNNDTSYLINKYAKSKNINFLVDVNKKQKQKIMSTNGVFFANQTNEPFGISTLELTNNKRFITGHNLGGTSEIIDTGINGLLYPQNKKTTNKVLKYFTNKKNISFYANKNISWKKTAENLLRLCSFLKNEPMH